MLNADTHASAPSSHPCSSMEAVQLIVGKGGALRAANEAKAVEEGDKALAAVFSQRDKDGNLKTDELITDKWLRDVGLKDCPKEKDLEAEADALAKVLLGKLHQNGIYYLVQLQALSMHGQLNEVLECVGVSMKITETFDRLVALDRRKDKVISFLMSLSGNLASMDAMCTNYGLAAALVLTMTFANFGSITHEDWMEYRRNVILHVPKCQELGITNCVPEGLQKSDNIMLDYTRPAFCMEALNTLIDDPAANLTGTDLECCIDVVQCIADEAFKTELFFGFGNGGGTAILLLVVLFSSWLFISLNATKANTNRWAEAKVLSNRLRQEFLLLQFLFSVGMLFAFAGMGSVMIMKSETRGMSWLLYWIIIVATVVSIGFGLKSLWEVFHINHEIDYMRSDGTDSLAETVAAINKRNSSPGSPRRAKAEGESKAGEAQASDQAKEAEEPSQVTTELERDKPGRRVLRGEKESFGGD